MRTLSSTFNSIQKYLFPVLEEEIGKLTEKQREFVRTVELIEPERFMDSQNWSGFGRPPSKRQNIFKAYIAKSVYNYPTTKVLIENLISSPSLRRLCGWEYPTQVPSESTFSRAFKGFAEGELTQKVHDTLIVEHLSPRLNCHVSTDSTAIKAREKSCRKNKPKNKKKAKRGRPRKDEVRELKPKRRLELQPHRSLTENLADLPCGCDWGKKKDSKNKTMQWKGYKLHIDTIDGDIPVSTILTSASPHDNQIAIPLMQMTSQKLTSLYNLMDAAYDAPEIHEYSRNLQHVPIIDHNKRRGEKKEFEPARKKRYQERSAAERVNSYLKDNYGGETVRVKGHKKVFAHLMFGLIAITAKQLFKLLS
jgi:hypothetical protein